MTKNNLKILAPYVRVGFQNGALYLGFGSIQHKVLEATQQKQLIELCNLWCQPLSEIDALKEMTDRGYQLTEVHESIKLLREGNFLIEPGLFKRENRFSRHFLYYALSGADPKTVQSRLAKKSVMVLGCGGIGNQVAVSLATAGVGRLILVDDDEIELSNLTRQILFTEADEGKPKVDILAREVRKRASPVAVESHSVRLQSRQDLDKLPKPDLIILSADSSAATSVVNHWAIENNVAYLPIGYVNDIACYGPFVIPQKTACFDCEALVARDPVEETTLVKLKKINRRFQAPSVGPVNMMASSLGLLDALRYLGNFGEIQSLNKRIGIWTHNLHKEIQEITPDPHCKTCCPIHLRRAQ